MSRCRIVGVFGISGVGKSTLIARASENVPSLHVQASALIKESLADPMMHSEALRRRSGDQVRANQDILVKSFWRTVHAQHCQLVIFDGHLVVDTDSELFEIPPPIIRCLQPSLMVHVEDDATKIADRRMRDSRRTRPARPEATLREHQKVSRQLCKLYARQLVQRGIQKSHLNAVTRCTNSLNSSALCEQTSVPSVCSRALGIQAIVLQPDDAPQFNRLLCSL